MPTHVRGAVSSTLTQLAYRVLSEEVFQRLSGTLWFGPKLKATTNKMTLTDDIYVCRWTLSMLVPCRHFDPACA